MHVPTRVSRTWLQVYETKLQLLKWRVDACDCAITHRQIDRAIAAGYRSDGPDVPGGLLSRAAVRSELARLQRMIAENIRDIRLAQLRAKANFNPAQPRVPKRNPGGGRWTREGGGLATELSAVRRKPPAGVRPHADFHQLKPTLDQQLRYGEASRRADEALAQVHKLDPNWKPTLGAYDITNAESAIRRANDEALEAEKRFLELLRDAPAQGATQATGGAESTENILVPEGRPIGLQARGASKNIRTVMPREFYEVFDRLKKGAWSSEEAADYLGLRYGRLDGTTVGLRFSERNGLTIDVLKSDGPVARNGFRVHRR